MRQWVLSLPFDLRVRAAFDHALARITTRAIESRYRRLARRAVLREPCGGAVTVIQRFGSDLRVNLRFHILTPDGAWGQDERGRRRFFTAPAPSPDDVRRVLERVVRRASAHLARDDDADPLDDEALALAQTHAAAARAQGAHTHRPDEPLELLDTVLCRHGERHASTASTWTPKSPSKSTGASASSLCAATCCARHWPSTG